MDAGADFLFDKSTEFDKVAEALKQFNQAGLTNRGSPGANTPRSRGDN